MYNKAHLILSLLAILLSTPLLTRGPLIVFVYLLSAPPSVVCSSLCSLHAATNSIMNLTLALPSPASPAATPPHTGSCGLRLTLSSQCFGMLEVILFRHQNICPRLTELSPVAAAQTFWAVTRWHMWWQVHILAEPLHEHRPVPVPCVCPHNYCSPWCVSSLQTWPRFVMRFN